MDKSGWNMYVFRDGRRSVLGQTLVEALSAAVRALETLRGSDALVSVLLCAGELECALADAESEFESVAAEVTDAVARELVGEERVPCGEMIERIGRIVAPATVCASVHEGFAYYGLHPLKFARVIERIELKRNVGVVGIRSIGVALSAVTLAALRQKGVAASRITVRPAGHPYDRELRLSAAQKEWARTPGDADFLVVDEGPGLSGSSFLATGEAIEREGVAMGRIVLVGTRVPHPADLHATEGARRWERFRSISIAQEPFLPNGAEVELGGGRWRDVLLAPQAERPSSWTQLECLKYLSADRKYFFRFEGYGHYGEEAARRAWMLGEAGFGPQFFGNRAGFGCYEFVDGRELSIQDASDALLSRIASYCAFRARHFRCELERNTELEAMMRFNWGNEFGAVLEPEIELPVVCGAVTDSRMAPHEWRLAGNGVAMKVDAVSDGDGHFFPGACDIAWDLAGTVVEWRLSPEATERFLGEYSRVSGDDVCERVLWYEIAYATLHMAYARLAARAMGGTAEELLFIRDYERYRRQALDAHVRFLKSREGQLCSAAPSAHGPEDTIAA